MGEHRFKWFWLKLFSCPNTLCEKKKYSALEFFLEVVLPGHILNTCTADASTWSNVICVKYFTPWMALVWVSSNQRCLIWQLVQVSPESLETQSNGAVHVPPPGRRQMVQGEYFCVVSIYPITLSSLLVTHTIVFCSLSSCGRNMANAAGSRRLSALTVCLTDPAADVLVQFDLVFCAWTLSILAARFHEMHIQQQRPAAWYRVHELVQTSFPQMARTVLSSDIRILVYFAYRL